MSLEEMTEVKKPSVIYEDNQGDIFLENNRQVGIRTKHIDIRKSFLREMVEDKDIDIKNIRREENPVDIMRNNTYEEDFVKHMKRIIEVEI